MTHSEKGGRFLTFQIAFSSFHFFTECCQILYIKSVPFLLTISPCCQGVNQKVQVSFSHFINKTWSVVLQTPGALPKLS